MDRKEVKATGKTRKAAEKRLARHIGEWQSKGWVIYHALGSGWIVSAFDGQRWTSSIKMVRG